MLVVRMLFTFTRILFLIQEKRQDITDVNDVRAFLILLYLATCMKHGDG